MKKTIAAFCLLGSTIALSACEGTGFNDTAPPYTMARTATHAQEMEPMATPMKVAPATHVFQKAQTK